MGTDTVKVEIEMTREMFDEIQRIKAVIGAASSLNSSNNIIENMTSLVENTSDMLRYNSVFSDLMGEIQYEYKRAAKNA